MRMMGKKQLIRHSRLIAAILKEKLDYGPVFPAVIPSVHLCILVKFVLIFLPLEVCSEQAKEA